jgi:hypothetical protein
MKIRYKGEAREEHGPIAVVISRFLYQTLAVEKEEPSRFFKGSPTMMDGNNSSP